MSAKKPLAKQRLIKRVKPVSDEGVFSEVWVDLDRRLQAVEAALASGPPPGMPIQGLPSLSVPLPEPRPLPPTRITSG